MLKKPFTSLIFPTSDLRGDWYKSKGYENFTRDCYGNLKTSIGEGLTDIRDKKLTL